MALRLEIISRHRQGLGERGVKEFGQSGGTMGRSLESDWVLPDSQRFLSSRHASIDFRSGSYYIIDTSTNGVFINDSEKPVGRGRPQRLFTNDRIRIGDYEMLVEIDDMDNTRETLVESSHIDPVDMKQRVEAPDPTSYDLVDAYEITGVGIEMLLDEDEADTLVPPPGQGFTIELVEEPQPKPAPKVKPAAKAKPKTKATAAKPSAPQAARATAAKPPAPKPAPADVAAPRAASTGATAAGTSQALDELLRGAGLDPRQLDEGDAKHILQNLGRVFREVIVGLNENLYLRSAHKNMLKQPNTTIQPRGNNPLKFSASVDEALQNLVFRKSDEYLPAVEAVRDAFGDIKWHQHALVKALTTAVPSYVARLDPDRLEEKLARGRTSALMGAANKLKYWDLYKDLYLVVTQHPDDELPVQFLEELAQAYEHESARSRPTQKKGASPTLQAKAG